MTTRDLYVEDLDTGRRQSFHGGLFSLSIASAVWTAVIEQRPGVSPDGPTNCAQWDATVEGNVLIELIREAAASKRGNDDGPTAASIEAGHRYRLQFIEF